ncbi:MAG: hypothetical protein LIO42_04085 [Oscillospiraceae bacterium]|nr:hypothetical protein [Oscillospiraceae bacterium]
MEKANETTEQQTVMDWAAYAVKRWPGLRNLYHVPNEARRSPAIALLTEYLQLQPGQRMRADTAQWKQRWGFPAVKEEYENGI